MTTPLVTSPIQNQAFGALSLHEKAIGNFLTGRDVLSYMSSLERCLEGRSKLLNINMLTHTELQGALLLCLALWEKTGDSDYCKLFIQILPHYLTRLEEAEGDVATILSHGIDGPLQTELVDLLNVKPRELVSKNKEFGIVRALLKKHVQASCFEDIHETSAHAIADWQKTVVSQKNFDKVLVALSKIVALNSDRERFFSCYSSISRHLLSITQKALFLFKSCFDEPRKEHMEKAILPFTPMRELYVEIVTHPSFPDHEKFDVIDWSIENGWIDHAVAIMSGYLRAKWEPSEHPDRYDAELSALSEIAHQEPLAPYKYILLHKIAQKQEEIRSDTRVLLVKQLAALVKGR